MMNDEPLNEKALAKRWGVSVRTLQHWRQHGTGPVFTEISEGVVRYRMEDVLDHEVKRRKIKTTKDEKNADQ